MALTLNGTTSWPDAKALARFGETRIMGTPSKLRQILERVADAMAETATELQSYMKDHGDFAEVGKAMLQEWETGRRMSLGGV
jgi:serine/threonine-protein kinase HipA